LKIHIFYEVTKYRFPGWRKAVVLIDKIIRSEGMIPGEINFIITTDEILTPINSEFLNHNYNTDVIAFENNSGNELNGEIYISKDTVKRNASNYKVSLECEILRVMIHGILHLTGYSDKTRREKAIMHKIENMWLEKYFE